MVFGIILKQLENNSNSKNERGSLFYANKKSNRRIISIASYLTKKFEKKNCCSRQSALWDTLFFSTQIKFNFNNKAELCTTDHYFERDRGGRIEMQPCTVES